MDNNNNKQFFWEVKDFLGKNHHPKPSPKQPDILSTINEVVNFKTNKQSPNLYEVKDSILNSSSSTKKAVNRVLNSYKQKLNLEQNNCKAYSNNITTNMFNLFKR